MDRQSPAGIRFRHSIDTAFPAGVSSIWNNRPRNAHSNGGADRMARLEAALVSDSTIWNLSLKLTHTCPTAAVMYVQLLAGVPAYRVPREGPPRLGLIGQPGGVLQQQQTLTRPRPSRHSYRPLTTRVFVKV
jgi:hypothetical protein